MWKYGNNNNKYTLARKKVLSFPSLRLLHPRPYSRGLLGEGEMGKGVFLKPVLDQSLPVSIIFSLFQPPPFLFLASISTFLAFFLQKVHSSHPEYVYGILFPD